MYVFVPTSAVMCAWLQLGSPEIASDSDSISTGIVP